MSPPTLTVYTIGQHSADDCRDVLYDLRAQTAADHLEVLVVAPSMGDLQADDFDCFERFHWVEVEHVKDCGSASAEAVRTATAPFVVYAEEHETFDPHWAAELIAAHEQGYDVVGFAMTNANPRTATSWAHLYGQFGPVVHPTEPRESDFLAGHHVSYRRSLLLDYGEHLSTALEDESALFLDLRSRGVPLFIAGQAISHHVNISSFSSLAMIEFVGLRSFAASRAAIGKWSIWRRIGFALASPLIPCVRLARIVKHLRRSGRLGMLPRLLPPLIPALLCGALGEATGYVLGPGRSAELKAPIELRRQEFVARSDQEQATSRRGFNRSI